MYENPCFNLNKIRLILFVDPACIKRFSFSSCTVQACTPINESLPFQFALWKSVKSDVSNQQAISSNTSTKLHRLNSQPSFSLEIAQNRSSWVVGGALSHPPGHKHTLLHKPTIYFDRLLCYEDIGIFLKFSTIYMSSFTAILKFKLTSICHMIFLK